MNTIWRFYIDENRQWRWQQLSVSRAVISESAGAFKAYEACIAGAQEQGYVYAPGTEKPFVPKQKTGKRSA